MTLEEYRKMKPENVEEYDPPVAINSNPSPEQIAKAQKLLEKYEKKISN